MRLIGCDLRFSPTLSRIRDGGAARIWQKEILRGSGMEVTV
jgi:hypothetical protein